MKEMEKSSSNPPTSMRVSYPSVVANTDLCSVLPVCASEKKVAILLDHLIQRRSVFAMPIAAFLAHRNRVFECTFA